MFGNRPLRIVHCVRSPIGGIFRHIVDLAEEQTRMGHEVGIVCDSSTGGTFEAKVIAEAAPRLKLGITRVPMRRQISPADLRASLGLLGFVKGLGPDVLHGHGAKGGAYARAIGTALRLTGRRPLRIYCPHGGSLHYDRRSAGGALFFGLERLLERVTDGFVFVSAYEERRFRENVAVPRRPFRLVRNGLRPEEFEPLTPDADAADIVFCGMVRRLKGPQVLIEAAALIAREDGTAPSVRILGDGDDRPAMERLVHEFGLAGRITFHDPVPTRQALAMGRMLVLPSLAESMPYIVLEAAAARMPVLATKVGGVPEIYGSRADRLLPPGDAAALAAAIRRALADPERTAREALDLGAAVAGRFSLGRMAGEIQGFYEELFQKAGVITSAPAGRRTPIRGLHPDHYR